MRLRIDEKDLTIADLIDFEDIVGKPYDEVLKPRPVFERDEETDEPVLVDGRKVIAKDGDGKPIFRAKMSMKQIAALVFIVLRHEDASMTFEKAKQTHITELEFADADPPTDDEQSG